MSDDIAVTRLKSEWNVLTKFRKILVIVNLGKSYKNKLQVTR